MLFIAFSSISTSSDILMVTSGLSAQCALTSFMVLFSLLPYSAIMGLLTPECMHQAWI